MAKPEADDAAHYAAALYAITNTRPDLSPEDRAALADAIVACQRERGLIGEDISSMMKDAERQDREDGIV